MSQIKRASKPKPGEALQKLVEVIEKTVHAREGVHVESPCRLPDKDTGRMREHDVVVTFSNGHHRTLMALECRDRSRMVGVPELEAFAAKCQKTGVHQGSVRFPVTSLHVVVQWKRQLHFFPFEFHSYFDQARSKDLYGAAVANVSVAGLAGDLVVLQGEKSTQVSFVPRAKPR